MGWDSEWLKIFLRYHRDSWLIESIEVGNVYLNIPCDIFESGWIAKLSKKRSSNLGACGIPWCKHMATSDPSSIIDMEHND